MFDQGYGDIGNTNHGYTDYKKIHLKTNDDQPVNKGPDNKITTDILYKNHNHSYQLLSDNENNIYHRQHADMDYANYQVEIDQNIGSDNGTINYENAIYL